MQSTCGLIAAHHVTSKNMSHLESGYTSNLWLREQKKNRVLKCTCAISGNLQVNVEYSADRRSTCVVRGEVQTEDFTLFSQLSLAHLLDGGWEQLEMFLQHLILLMLTTHFVLFHKCSVDAYS